MYSIEELAKIVHDTVVDYPVSKVILVGSYAKNTSTEISDVDLVLDGDDLSEAYLSFYHRRWQLSDLPNTAKNACATVYSTAKADSDRWQQKQNRNRQRSYVR